MSHAYATYGVEYLPGWGLDFLDNLWYNIRKCGEESCEPVTRLKQVNIFLSIP